MILIADCGSTKIDWCLLNGNEKVAQIFTTGMNALMMTEEEMTATIRLNSFLTSVVIKLMKSTIMVQVS